MTSLKKKLILVLFLLLLIAAPYLKDTLDTQFGKTSLFETYFHFQKAKLGVMPVIEPKVIKQKVKRVFSSEEANKAMMASTATLHYTHDPLCQYEMPAEPILSAKLGGVKLPSLIKPGQKFKVQFLLENTGNVRWYGDESGCKNQRFTRLGTDQERDRTSLFYNQTVGSGWLSNNRVKLKKETVEPGETGTFEFESIAPEEKDLYREYFAPLMETYAWFEGASYYVDISVGAVSTQTHERMSIMSRTVKGSELTGDRNIQVDLSEQRMKLRFGETVVREFPISTGKRATPTPKGKFEVLNKMEVRVGAAWPHYVMPKWMGFTKWGHGIHALPSLKNDGGVFWTEARDHIGIPVSHGCIRLLPEDAEFAHDKFGEIGTTMEVVS